MLFLMLTFGAAWFSIAVFFVLGHLQHNDDYCVYHGVLIIVLMMSHQGE